MVISLALDGDERRGIGVELRCSKALEREKIFEIVMPPSNVVVCAVTDIQ